MFRSLWCLGRFLGLGVRRHHDWTTEKGHGSSWYVSIPCKRPSWEDIREEERQQLDLESNANSFRSFWWEVQYCSQHHQVIEEETGLRNWDQWEWHHHMFGGRQQMQNWFRRLDRLAWKAVLVINMVDSLLWHGKSYRQFWGINRNVVQAGNSAWWTRDDGRKAKV